MEKILLPINSLQQDPGSLNFACYIAELTHSSLTGIFFEEVIQPKETELNKFYKPEREYLDLVEIEEIVDVFEQNSLFFKKTCARRGIRSEVLCVSSLDGSVFIKKSRFADLMIINDKHSPGFEFEGMPGTFARYILSKAECPVITSPENFDEIKEIVITYDGSASSVFAIKQFTYLFPQLKDTRTILLQVNKGEDWSFECENEIKLWLGAHYSEVVVQTLQGKVQDQLYDYLLKKENTLVVMGAYGRNTISSFLKESTAGTLLQRIDLPFFISHR